MNRNKEQRIKELELELQQLKGDKALLFKDHNGKVLKVGDEVWSPYVESEDPVVCRITHLWLEWPSQTPTLLATGENYDEYGGVSMKTTDCKK